jgi:hypothetical protein
VPLPFQSEVSTGKERAFLGQNGLGSDRMKPVLQSGANAMAKKVEQYIPRIKNGLPPPRVKTRYNAKIVDGELIGIGDRIKHGQYVEDLSAGSAGKLAKRVKERGLTVVRRPRQGESRGTVYVVTPQWLAEHPEV